MKLCIRIFSSEHNTEITGPKLRACLREHGIDPEAFTASSCLITFNLGSEEQDAKRLINALKEIASSKEGTNPNYTPLAKKSVGITD
jgi:arginine/lysine/ornithine decarboxylase